MTANKPTTLAKVEAIRHGDRSANIPTEELGEFMAQMSARPRMCSLPSLQSSPWGNGLSPVFYSLRLVGV